MQIEIFMAVENISEHKYQRDSPTTHPFQMNDTQTKMGLDKRVFFYVVHVFYVWVKKIFTVGKQQLFQFMDFAENMLLGQVTSVFCSPESFLSAIKKTEQYSSIFFLNCHLAHSALQGTYQIPKTLSQAPV